VSVTLVEVATGTNDWWNLFARVKVAQKRGKPAAQLQKSLPKRNIERMNK
jgi:hypothetical protein